MPRKPRPPLSFIEQMKRIKDAQIEPFAAESEDYQNLDSIELRVQNILGLTKRIIKRPDRMLFFVMYDIEGNKVRRLVSKYLIKKGCTRIQRSIFLAEASVDIYNSIKSDLAVVQQAYENKDSIIVLPVSTDYLKKMKIIGKNIDVDIITNSCNTLFF